MKTLALHAKSLRGSKKDQLSKTDGEMRISSSPPTAPSSFPSPFSSDDILSAGQDGSLRSISTVHEKFSKCLGHASYDKKKTKRLGLKKGAQFLMPPIKEFHAVPTRQSDWDSIVCIHRWGRHVSASRASC